MKPKNLNLFLMDGTVTGRVKCTLANWTGVVYKIPRLLVDKSSQREDLKFSGVYFLFGSDEQTGNPVVYVGQAGNRKNGEGIYQRLLEHRSNSEKDYWQEAVVVTTTNNILGPTEISYLENRFCRLATDANRYLIKNGNEPSSGNVTEEKQAELEEFIEYAKLVVGTLGYPVFEPLRKPAVVIPEEEVATPELPLLYLDRKSRKSNQVIKAQCQQTLEGFVVLAGSKIEVIDSESIPETIQQRRQQAKISDGVLQQDELFASPSYAASFVIGGSVNGLTAWKTAEGQLLKELGV
ncbi:MAG: GIY-YIG nuclease family protein [Culicoidibacterales bacterium]